MTTEDKLLCRGGPYGTGFALVGLWCLLRLPFGCVICGANWVVLWCGLKPTTTNCWFWSLLGGAPEQVKVSYCLCLAWG